MSAFLAQLAGAKGCDDQVGTGTFTVTGNKKIGAIGILADANITSFIYTDSNGTDVTVNTKAWMGVTLGSADAVNAFIPLEYGAKSVVVASGTVRMYFK